MTKDDISFLYEKKEVLRYEQILSKEISKINISSCNLIQRNVDLKLDEFGIWNKSLSNSEISILYNNGVGITYPFFNSFTTLY